MSMLGWGFGIAMYFVYFSWTAVCYFMLKRVADEQKCYGYRQLMERNYPKWVSVIVAVFHMVFTFGTLIAYTIVCRDNLFFFSEEDKWWKNLVMAGIMFLIVLPLCYLPSLESLKFNSYVDVAVMLFFIVVLAITYGQTEPKPEPHVAMFTAHTLYAFPMLAHTYVATLQFNFLGIYSELEDQNKNVFKVTAGNSVLAMTIYICSAFFGYFSFGDETASNIIKNLTAIKSAFTIAANGGMILMIIVHVPVVVYNVRRNFELFAITQPTPRRTEIIIATAIVVSMVGIGLFLDRIDNVLDFTSSLCGGTIGLVVPGLLFAKIAPSEQWRLFSYVWAGFGAAVMIFGFAVACYKWFWMGGK